MNNALILTFPISIKHFLILKQKFPLKALGILMSLTIFALLAFYIFQVNSVVTESYLAQDYQKKINETSRENGNLIINSAKINSLGNIEEGIKELGFEKVDKVYYLQILEEEFVTK